MAKSIAQEFTKGLWNEIPPFRLVLGLCPVLGVTTSMENGIGIGPETIFALICNNDGSGLVRLEYGGVLYDIANYRVSCTGGTDKDQRF